MRCLQASLLVLDLPSNIPSNSRRMFYGTFHQPFRGVHRRLYWHVCRHVFRHARRHARRNARRHACRHACGRAWPHVCRCARKSCRVVSCGRSMTPERGAESIGSKPASPTASPTASLLHGCGRAGARNHRLDENFPTVRDTCRAHVYEPWTWGVDLLGTERRRSARSQGP